ncbi:hypothetical protein DOTSEDRAFT_26243 [Dothistroma septosporum NZE10]|uniref:Uncharacterized protein n=1 Tax=Dothistroma septosporum (strain NZE10 / CBS 128990) TaxID=675120 RepID=N1PMJ7_DOTSN|nr:hypothetical protein DOTSEDRAFT_26243 [Dothistroma septosporum NZE10]
MTTTEMQSTTNTNSGQAVQQPQFSNLFTSFFSIYRTNLKDSATESLLSARASLLESKDFSAADKIEDAILASHNHKAIDRANIGSDKPFPSSNSHACREVMQARDILARAGDEKGVESVDEIMEKVFNRACLGSTMLGREWTSA